MKPRKNKSLPQPKDTSPPAKDRQPPRPDTAGERGSHDARLRQDAYQGQNEAHVHDDRELEAERPREDGISERRPVGRIDIERI